MIVLDSFKEAGFLLTWKLLDLGFRRCEHFAGSLSAKEIANFAQDCLDVLEDEGVLMLAVNDVSDNDGIDLCLRVLAENENSSYSEEYRKWRVLYVRDGLPNLQDDSVHGLIQLLEIWSALDFPEDSPHVVQGRHNQITPTDYYTKENYRALLKSHYDWIEGEIADILKLQTERLSRITIE